MAQTSSVAGNTTPRPIPLNFDDVLDFTEHMHPWSLDFTQVRRGRFHSSGFLLELDSLTMANTRLDQAMVRRCFVPPGQFSVFTIGRDSDACFLGEQSLRIGNFLAMPGNSDFEAVTRGRFADLALSFDETVWHAAGEWLSPAERSATPYVRNFGAQWAEQLYALIDRVVGAANSANGAFSNPAVREMLAERVLAHVRSGQPVPGSESNEHRVRARRRAAVQRAREFIGARLCEPIRLAQVCRYACAQSRTLEYGFREMFDTPMVSYIKALRMDRVRRLLLSPTQSHRTVSELALDTGFWHLSQFASDYKKFFGESPSQTHRRAGGATGPRLMSVHA